MISDDIQAKRLVWQKWRELSVSADHAVSFFFFSPDVLTFYPDVKPFRQFFFVNSYEDDFSAVPFRDIVK